MKEMIVVSTLFLNQRFTLFCSSVKLFPNPLDLKCIFISQVNFLTKLVAVRPGQTVRDMIKTVMQGKDEGAESSKSKDGVTEENIPEGIAGRVSYDIS